MPTEPNQTQSYRGEMTSISNLGEFRANLPRAGICRCIPDESVKVPGRPPKRNQSKGPSTVTSSSTSRERQPALTIHFPILHRPGLRVIHGAKRRPSYLLCRAVKAPRYHRSDQSEDGRKGQLLGPPPWGGSFSACF